jgi:hypothetical protein
MPNSQTIFSCIRRGTSCILMKWVIFVLDKYADHDFYFITLAHWQNMYSPQENSSLCVKFQPTSLSKIYLKYHLIQPTISLEMPVPSQGHYGFHSFPVVDWFCLFIYLWVLTFPFEDYSEFGILLLLLFHEIYSMSRHVPFAMFFLIMKYYFQNVMVHVVKSTRL